MDIKIKETGEIKELSIIDRKSGCNWVKDLITAPDFWNSETEEYEMSQDDYDWWKKYIDNHNSDEQEAENLSEELGIELSEIENRVSQEMNGINDYEDHHRIKQYVFENLKSEYK